VILPYFLPEFGVTEPDMVKYTIANSIFGTLVASISANYEFFKSRFIFPKYVFTVGVFGIVGSLLVQYYVVYSSWYNKPLFDKVVISIMAIMILRLLIKNKEVAESEEKNSIFQLGMAGFGGSFVSALSGLGGGVLIIPFLNSFCKIGLRKASSISLGVIGITSFSMTIANLIQNTNTTYSSGYIIWPVVITLSVGVVITTKFGVQLAQKLSPSVVKLLFAGFIALVIIKKALELV
jgi:uncharacterized protein